MDWKVNFISKYTISRKKKYLKNLPFLQFLWKFRQNHADLWKMKNEKKNENENENENERSRRVQEAAAGFWPYQVLY